MAVGLWWMVIVGLGFGLWPRFPVPRAGLVAGSALALFAALAGASMLWASDDGRAFAELVRTLSYLGLFTVVVLSTRPGDAVRWLTGLTIGITAVASIALLSRLEPEPFPVLSVTETIADAAARLSYPLEYWNGLGAMIAAGVILLVWRASGSASRRGAALAAAFIPPLVLGVYLTSSQGAIVALALGLAVLLLDQRRAQHLACMVLGGVATLPLMIVAALSPQLVDGLVETAAARGQGDRMLVVTVVVMVLAGLARSWLHNRLSELRLPIPDRRLLLGAGAVVLIAFVVLADPIGRIADYTAAPAAVPGQASGSELVTVSAQYRAQYWGVALDGFRSAPLTGLGAGAYESWWGQNAPIPQYTQFAHSLIFESLAELGLVGLVLLLVFVLTPLLAGIAQLGRRDYGPALAPALAVAVAGLFSASIDWIWQLPAAFVPAVIALGLLAGPALGRVTAAGTNRFGIGVATLGVAWIAVLAGSASLYTELKVNASRESRERGDATGAAQDAREARAVQPWAAGPRFQEALAEELAGNLPAASAALDQAIARAPEDWQLWFAEARLRRAQEDLEGAREATLRTNALKPDVGLVGR